MDINLTQSEMIKLSLIEPNNGQIEGLPKNPRFIKNDKYEKLKKSLEEHPQMLALRELLVYPHGDKYVIIGGNMRYRAMKELKFKTAPCKVISASTSVDDLKAYTIKDNSGFGDWDFDLLANDWDMSLLEDCAIDVPSFDDIMEEEPNEATEDDFDEETDKVETKVKFGEVWQLGEHRLMCGDSTDEECVKTLMKGELADIEFTSPPYNAGLSEKLSGNTHTGESKYLSNDDNLTNYDELLFKSTKNGIENAKYAIINIQMLAGNKEVFCEYLKHFKNYLCDIGIWVKTTTAPAMAERVMNSQFEFVMFFSKINNSRAVGTNNFRGTMSNVFECCPQRKNEFSNIHAATFSIEFASHYITGFSKEKDVVLDLFGGTGTTLIACEQLNRKCLMMELDPHYCDVIIARWEKLTGKKAEKIA